MELMFLSFSFNLAFLWCFKIHSLFVLHVGFNIKYAMFLKVSLTF